MQCSYCKTNMFLTKKEIKRPVPNGAKDLNIFDEIVCWECPKCKLTTIDEIWKCECGMLSIHAFFLHGAKLIPGVFIREPIESDVEGSGSIKYRCTNCIKCNVCNKPIGSEEYTYNSYWDYFGPDRIALRVYNYLHKTCAQLKLKEYRRKEGLCELCGVPLSFLSKISGNERCKNCR